MERLRERRGREPQMLSPAEADRVQIIRGGAGTGKTTWATDRTAMLVSQGYRALRVCGDPADPTPAVLRGLWHSDLVAEPAVTGLRAFFSDATQRDDEVARVWAVSDALRQLRREHRIAVALDDGHLLDALSRQVLPAFLSAPGQAVGLAIAVDGDAGRTPDWAGLLSRLTELREVETVALERLSNGECADLLDLPDDVAGLDGATRLLGGNPLLVHAFRDTAGAGEGGLETQVLGWARRGGGAHDELLRRFCRDRVQSDVARVVALLDGAAVGRSEMLAAVVGSCADSVVGALESLQAREVVHEREGILRIEPPALAAMLTASTSPARAHVWRGRAIEWLGALPASAKLDVELAELHLEHSEPGDEIAVERLLRAASSLETAQPAAVTRYLECTLDLVSAADPRIPSLRLILARALLLDGRVQEAQRVAEDALPGLTDPKERARAHRIVAEAAGTLGRQDPALVAGIGDSVGGTDHLIALRAHLAARLGDLTTARNGVLAVRAALDTDGYAERLVSAVHMAHAEGMLADYAGMLDTIGRIEEVVDGEPVPTRLVAHTNLAFLLGMHGDPRATRHLAAADELRSGAHLGLMRLELETAHLVAEFHDGRWDDALTRIDRIRPDLEGAGSVAGLTLVGSIELGIMVHRGRWSSARRVSLDHHDDAATGALDAWSAAAVDLRSGEARTALELLDDALRRSAPPRFRHLLLVRAAEAELATRLPARARDHLRTVLADAGTGAALSLTAIDATRLLGSIDGDLDLLRTARDAAAGRTASFLQATTLLSLAEAGSDPEPTLREAYERFHVLGADPWRRRCAAELRTRGFKVPRHRAPRPTGLTDVELQVARLVQVGRQNREIASSLSLSVKTVEAYLTRIYAKLDCSSRLELARKLDQDGGAAGP